MGSRHVERCAKCGEAIAIGQAEEVRRDQGIGVSVVLMHPACAAADEAEHDDDPMAALWRQVDERTVEVQISPALQLTWHGLALAIRRIPHRVRDGFKSYEWEGDREEDGVRWGIIRVTT